MFEDTILYILCTHLQMVAFLKSNKALTIKAILFIHWHEELSRKDLFLFLKGNHILYYSYFVRMAAASLYP